MWDKLWEAIQKYGGSARDARIGAVGADQVRDLYKSDKQEDKALAKELNDRYLAASAAGIAGGATAASALTSGVVPTLVSEAGGAAGSYVGNKTGSYLDEKLDTKWIAPTLSIVGGLGGGIAGYKGLEGVTNQHIINKAFKSGQLKYGQPTSYTAYHQSNVPITEFKFPFKRWDVVKHNADPNGAFFTVGKPAGSGFLSERPYIGQFQVNVKKPLIQTGELTGPTKNGLRNAIVKRARKNGADAVFFDDIADNTLQNQQILFAMDNSDIKFIGGK